MECLNNVTVPIRPVDKPLRIPVQQVYKIGKEVIVTGRVATGVLKVGMAVTFAPYLISSSTSRVQSIQLHRKPVQEAHPGQYVGFTLNLSFNNRIRRGFVVSDSSNDPAADCEAFDAQVIIINHPTTIRNGYTPITDCHTAHIACEWKIRQKLDRKTQTTVEEEPAFLKNGDMALVTMRPVKPMCVETYSTFPALGRFVVRDQRQIIAVGIIKSKMGLSVLKTKSAKK